MRVAGASIIAADKKCYEVNKPNSSSLLSDDYTTASDVFPPKSSAKAFEGILVTDCSLFSATHEP